MPELEAIRELARQALIIPMQTSDFDGSVWDRAERLVRNVKYICEIPELSKSSLQIDRFCLITATYFSDAGLASRLAAEKVNTKSIGTDTNGGDFLDVSAKVAAEKLNGTIEKTRIQKIIRIITESGEHSTGMMEAMILSDARNLDDIGAAGVFDEFRRFVHRGKSITDALESWKRKKAYQYWQARLKQGFQFEQVRKLAEQRFSASEYFMNQLETETEAQDLKELTVNSVYV